MKIAEKIVNHFSTPGEKREHKKRVVRARRREEKKDPENAPTKVKHFTQGWTI